MNFKERAIEAYERKKIVDDSKENKEIDQFYEKAIKALKDKFGLEEGIRIDTVEKLPGSATVRIDEIIIKISYSKGYHTFEMIKKCDRCGREYFDTVRSIEDVGKFLMMEHSKYDCDENIRLSKEGEGEETSQDRLIKALKDFINDSQNQ